MESSAQERKTKVALERGKLRTTTRDKFAILVKSACISVHWRARDLKAFPFPYSPFYYGLMEFAAVTEKNASIPPLPPNALFQESAAHHSP